MVMNIVSPFNELLPGEMGGIPRMESTQKEDENFVDKAVGGFKSLWSSIWTKTKELLEGAVTPILTKGLGDDEPQLLPGETYNLYFKKWCEDTCLERVKKVVTFLDVKGHGVDILKIQNVEKPPFEPQTMMQIYVHNSPAVPLFLIIGAVAIAVSAFGIGVVLDKVEKVTKSTVPILIVGMGAFWFFFMKGK